MAGIFQLQLITRSTVASGFGGPRPSLNRTRIHHKYKALFVHLGGAAAGFLLRSTVSRAARGKCESKEVEG